MSKTSIMSRRHVLQATAGVGAAMLAPRAVRAEITGNIKIGGLMPLTGAGGQFGPIMANVQRMVIDQVNAAGGIDGHHIDYFVEDDQTNPDAGVLAAHKLIDVDNVCAITGFWSSGVAVPVLPLCWQNKVMMFAVAASDALATMPHQGYFIRTNVPVALQGQAIGKFAQSQGVKNFYLMLAQNPFSASMMKGLVDEVTPGGMKTGDVIYDGSKTSFRSEVDQALQTNPDMILLGGYPLDSASIMKDIYRNGYKGKVVGTGTAITPQFITAAGKDVVEGVYCVAPAEAENSSAYKTLQQLAKKDVLDTNTCQAYDQINLVLLSIAAAHAATGVAIHDTVRKIGGPDGEVVGDVMTGMKLLSEGKKIAYSGASGPCVFLPNGNITSANFKTFQIKDGQLVSI